MLTESSAKSVLSSGSWMKADYNLEWTIRLIYKEVAIHHTQTELASCSLASQSRFTNLTVKPDSLGE